MNPLPQLPELTSANGADFIKETGKALLTPLRTLAHNSTDAANAFTGAVTTATGTVLTSKLNDDAYNLVGVAKKFYPYMGTIINAMINMGENNANIMTYDLAQDPKNLLPDGIGMRGIITKRQTYYTIFTLKDGYIEGLGTVNLDLTVRSYYYCYYCYEYVDFKATVQGVNGDITVSGNNNYVSRYYDYSSGHRTLDTVYIQNADTLVNWKNGDTTIHLHGTNSASLAWPSPNMRLLPIIRSFTAFGSYHRYDNTQEVRLPSVSISYTNNEPYYWYQDGVIDWAHRQSDYFTIVLALNAQLKISNTGYPMHKDIKLELGMSRAPYAPYVPGNYWPDRDYRRQWITIGQDQESYKFESTLTNAPRYALYTQSGALVEMLMKNDGKTLDNGAIKYRDKVIANISNSSAGPIVRFSDGSMQSF